MTSCLPHHEKVELDPDSGYLTAAGTHPPANNPMDHDEHGGPAMPPAPPGDGFIHYLPDGTGG